MKKLYIIILCLLLTSQVWAGSDIITDFSENSLPILNNELRKINEHIDNTDIRSSSFVVLGADGNLTSEAVLTGASGEIVVSNATLSLADTIDLSGHTAFGLPSSTSPSFSEEGQMAWDSDDNCLLVYDGASAVNVVNFTSSIVFRFDNPSTIAANDQEWVYIPYACTITGWTLLADATVDGSLIIDVWKDTYANFPPTIADVISGSEDPTIVATAIKGQDLSLTTWTDVTVDAGDVIMCNVQQTGNTKPSRAVLVLTITR